MISGVTCNGTIHVRTAIESGDVTALRKLLAANPNAANEHVVWGAKQDIRTHPLHFVSDMLFEGTLDRSREGDVAVGLVDALIEAGADLNHFQPDESGGEPKCETPLNGAASLGAQEVGIRLIDAGARTTAINLLGETSLHWAASLGLDRLVARILRAEAPDYVSIHVRDSNWDATPLRWAMHGWFKSRPGSAGRHRQVVVALVWAGAAAKIAALRGKVQG
jgi:ankyrin repeat protein